MPDLDTPQNGSLLFPKLHKKPLSDVKPSKAKRLSPIAHGRKTLSKPHVVESVQSVESVRVVEDHPALIFVPTSADEWINEHKSKKEAQTAPQPVKETQRVKAEEQSAPSKPKKQPTRQMWGATLFSGDPKIRNKVIVYALFLVACITGIHLASVAVRAARIRSAVLGATSAGLAALGQGQSLVLNQDTASSEHAFDLAQSYFSQGKLDLSSEGQLTAALIAATPQGQDANRILDAGTNISQAGTSLAQLSATAKGISISATGFASSQGLHASLASIISTAADAQEHLQAAQNDLQGVHASTVPQAYQSHLAKSSIQISTYIQTLQQVQNMAQLASSFFTQGPQTILILFENNNELRPGGGFIGTYGLYHMQNGVVTSQKISSIYDLDGQASKATKLAPPGEFAELTDSWALRDSNWFVDFPSDARKASAFYETEGKETPDAVITMTPDLFEDLLKITGPIPFPKYGVTLDADNFRQVTQLDTSDKTSSTPKQMLADFAPLLLQKISALPSGGNTAIANALLDNLKRKNIMIYDRSADVEQQLVAANWAGSIAHADKDYLMVSAANLGGGKSDIAMTQTLSLQSVVQPDDSIIDTLTYARKNTNTVIDPENPDNRDYIRFVVPLGSTLVSANGFSLVPYYKADGSAYQSFESQQKFSIDPDLATIDATAKVDTSSGTVSDVEGSQTTFGNWMIVPPGQTQTVTISYKLPFSFDGKSQSIVVQKQPGAGDISFTYDFSSAGSMNLPGVLWYTPNAAQVSSSNGLSVADTIDQDQIIGAVYATK